MLLIFGTICAVVATLNLAIAIYYSLKHNVPAAIIAEVNFLVLGMIVLSPVFGR